jgi:hypothetical protein
MQNPERGELSLEPHWVQKYSDLGPEKTSEKNVAKL